MRIALVLPLLLLAVDACADADTTAATLSDPAAECRYVATLCADAIQARDRARIDFALSHAAGAAKDDARHALQVIRAKHAAMPECFRVRDCAVLFDLDHFR